MNCSICGHRLDKTHYNFCPNCGGAVPRPAEHNRLHGHARRPRPSVGRRIAVVVYALSYLVLAAVSAGVGITIYRSYAAPDPAASFVTCRNGTKLAYKTLGISNPATDANHDNLIIDVACRDLGGNTSTNVLRSGSRAGAWQLGLAVFVGGLVLIELVKGTLAYLITGRFPGLGTLGRE